MMSIFSSALSRVITIILSLVSLPLSIVYFGTDRYGVIITITAIVTFMQLLGLSMASVVSVIGSQLSSLELNKILLKKINKLFFPYILTLSLFFSIAYKPVWHFLINNFYNGKIEDSYYAQIFLYLGLNLLLSLIFAIFQSFFISIKKIYISNIYQLITSLFNYIILILAIKCSLDIKQYFLLLLLVNIFIGVISIAHVFYLFKDINTDILKLSNMEVNKLSYRNIYITAITSTVILVISLILTQTDSLLIPYFMSASDLVKFSVLFKVITYEYIVYNIIFSTIVPYLGTWFHQGKWDEINKVYLKLLIMSGVIGISVIYVNTVYLKDIINFWLKKSIYIDINILIMLSIFLFINGIYSVNYIIYSTFNVKRKQMILISFIEPICKVCLSYIFIKNLGLIGAPISVLVQGFFVTLPITSLCLKFFSDNRVIIKFDLIIYIFIIVFFEVIGLRFIIMSDILVIRYLLSTVYVIILLIILDFIRKKLNISLNMKE